MPYKNHDDLWIFFPGDNRTVHGGEWPSAGAFREIEVDYDLSTLTAGTVTLVDPAILILPRNSTIESVQVFAETAATGGTSVDLGLQKFDGTALNNTGILAAFPIASLTPQGKETSVTVGSTGAGALIGTTTTVPGYFVITANGTFTAGKVRIRVKVFVPGADPNEHGF
jgi:hypothetical protein